MEFAGNNMAYAKNNNMDFAAELQKLIDAEETPPLDPLAELALGQANLLKAIRKKEDDLSLQVEEIYDIIKEADDNAKEVKAAAKREARLLESLLAISDMLDDVLRFLHEHGAAHVDIIAAKAGEAMIACGAERFGAPGEPLDPRLHTVASAEFSETPIEHITRVLQYGCAYNGKIARKASVIISKGATNL